MGKMKLEVWRKKEQAEGNSSITEENYTDRRKKSKCKCIFLSCIEKNIRSEQCKMFTAIYMIRSIFIRFLVGLRAVTNFSFRKEMVPILDGNSKNICAHVM